MSLENPGDLSKLDLNTLDSLLSVLNTSGTQNSNNALYQTIAGLIKRTKEIQSALAAALTQLKTEVDGGKLPNKAGGLLGGSYLTKNDDHITLPNARKAVAGSGISIDYGTAHEAIISGVAGGTPVFFPDDGGSDSILIPGPAGTTGAVGPTGPTGSSASGGGVPPFGLVDEYGGDEFALIPGPQGPGPTGVYGNLIARQAYAAGSDALLHTISSNTMTDMDATNGAVTFVTPASGNVIIFCSILHQSSDTLNAELYFGLRESTTTVATAYVQGNNSSTLSIARRIGVEFNISGLTPGSTHTYKLAHRLTVGSAGAYTGPNYGQLLMEVWDAATGSIVYVQGARQEGRLTLVSGTPVPTTDQTGKTTFYWTPCDIGLKSITTGAVTLWNGSALVDVGLAELSKALGTLTSGKNYNVYIDYNAGTPQLIIGAAWTNDTTMSETLVDQYDSSRKATITVLSGTPAYRFVGAFRTTSTTATAYSMGNAGTSQVGGQLFVANLYNRTDCEIKVIDTTDSWSYNTGTWRQANNAAGNKVEYLTVCAETSVQALVRSGINSFSNVGRTSRSGVGLDSTSAAPVGLYDEIYNPTTGGITWNFGGMYQGNPGIGYHYLTWMEFGGDGTVTWYGDNAGSAQRGLIARLLA